MSAAKRSILIVSPDPDVVSTMGSSLSAMDRLNVDTEATSVTEMNGRLARLAGNYDIVLFQTDGAASEIESVRTLAQSRRDGAILVALADSGISLAAARELTLAGVDEVLPLSGSQDEIRLLRSLAARPAETAAPAGRVIAVAQARGGVGASTVALNLADQLACEKRVLRSEVRRRVALLDLDLQFGSLGSMLDLPEQDTLFRLATEGTVPDATFLSQSVQTTARGLTVLSAPGQFVPMDALRNEQVSALIEGLRAAHDYVVIDLPHALVGWIEPVLARTDRLLIVTDTSVPAIRHCRRLADFVTSDNVALNVEVVVNRDRRARFFDSVRKEAEGAIGRPLAHWLPDDRRTARLAIDRGLPLSEVAPRAPLTRGVAALAASVLQSTPVLSAAATK